VYKHNVSMNFIRLPNDGVILFKDIDDYLITPSRKAAGEIIDYSSARTVCLSLYGISVLELGT